MYIVFLCTTQIPFIASLLSNSIAQRGTRKGGTTCIFQTILFLLFASYMTQKSTSIDILHGHRKRGGGEVGAGTNGVWQSLCSFCLTEKNISLFIFVKAFTTFLFQKPIILPINQNMYGELLNTG